MLGWLVGGGCVCPLSRLVSGDSCPPGEWDTVAGDALLFDEGSACDVICRDIWDILSH